MFAGIIKCVGIIESIKDTGSTKVFTVASPISGSLQIDQSISHDGVCLTIVDATETIHVIEVVNETLNKSSLSASVVGQHLNLEKAISLHTLLDGHLVQGHVDTNVTCIKIDDLNGSWKYHFELPSGFEGLLIPQGSICINGVSLTISDLNTSSFAVAIIPYTYANTNFKYLKTGSRVNVEFDLIGKYIVRQFELRSITE